MHLSTILDRVTKQYAWQSVVPRNTRAASENSRRVFYFYNANGNENANTKGNAN